MKPDVVLIVPSYTAHPTHTEAWWNHVQLPSLQPSKKAPNYAVSTNQQNCRVIGNCFYFCFLRSGPHNVCLWPRRFRNRAVCDRSVRGYYYQQQLTLNLRRLCTQHHNTNATDTNETSHSECHRTNTTSQTQLCTRYGQIWAQYKKGLHCTPELVTQVL